MLGECRCGEFDGVGVDGGVRVGVEVGRGAAVVIVGLQCEEPVSPGWATRPSYPIDAPSEEQLRLTFQEAPSAVAYSEDPGDDRRPLASRRKARRYRWPALT